MSDGQTCVDCHRPLAECRVPVDEHWPAEAREAFAAQGYTMAARCPKGQSRDMARTGWCLDRAVRSEYWRGPVPTGVTMDAEYVHARRERMRKAREISEQSAGRP